MSYKFNINGKNRVIRPSAIEEDTDNSFIATYHGFRINVSFDEDHEDYDKPWYATCINSEIPLGTIVDGWVGKSKEDAIEVCLSNIFYTPDY